MAEAGAGGRLQAVDDAAELALARGVIYDFAIFTGTAEVQGSKGGFAHAVAGDGGGGGESTAGDGLHWILKVRLDQRLSQSATAGSAQRCIETVWSFQVSAVVIGIFSVPSLAVRPAAGMDGGGVLIRDDLNGRADGLAVEVARLAGGEK